MAAHQASPSFTIYWSLLKLMSIELVMLSNHLIIYTHMCVYIYIYIYIHLILINLEFYLYGLSPRSSLESILAASYSGSSCVSLQHKTMIYVNVRTDSIFNWQHIIKNSFQIATRTGYKIMGLKITWGETQVSWILKSIPMILRYSQA